ncbi:MAG TPA: hypothetical protein VK337_22295 [Xanthobacteraceae bacterium]|nr:hypothetical protein [Xanthobacteraceae bacterium]
MAEQTEGSGDPASPHRLLNGGLRCFFMTLAIAVLGVALQYLLAPDTVAMLGKLRQFTPLTMIGLLHDSQVECGQNAMASLISSEMKCETQPLVGDWPTVGHWAARVPWPATLFAGPLDVVWHLFFTRQVIPALLAATQIVFGFGVSALILQKARDLPAIWVVVLLGIGTLIFGATATWLVLNLVPILYGGLLFVLPGVKKAAVAAITAALLAQCAIFGLGLRYLVADRPADTIADRAIKLFRR